MKKGIQMSPKENATRGGRRYHQALVDYFNIHCYLLSKTHLSPLG